jgi:hypothetical protein
VPVQAVPAAAIRSDQGQDYIYLAIDGKAVRQEVTTGDKIGEFIEITSPLPEQAAVIISSHNNLKNGAAITLE